MTSPLYLGIDLSTQSVKAILVDDNLQEVAETNVLFSSLTQYSTQDGIVVGPNGRVTSPVLMWVAALDDLFSQLRSTSQLGRVKAISVSGQQHGGVYWRKGASKSLLSLDSSRSLEAQLATAFSRLQSPIWMDSSTSLICRELNALVGGQEAMAKLTGSRAYERFTINQIAKFAREEPERYAETERISLVSSFAATLLTGSYVEIDAAEASGMNCMDIRTKDWVDTILGAVEEPLRLREKLGRVIDSSSRVGTISSYFAQRYGLDCNCEVIASSGDNPSSLAGLRLCVGEVAVSLGTSDTMFGPLRDPKPSIDGHIMANPIDSQTFMCMIVFSNGSLTRQSIRDRFANRSWEDFSRILKELPPGNDDNMGFYYLTPEITPSMPVGTHLFGRANESLEAFPNPQSNVRAILEGQFLAMLSHSKSIGLQVTERIIATGGASVNHEILQTLSNVFGVPVSVFDVPNSAALGAAFRAYHGFKKLSNPSLGFHEAVTIPREYFATFEPQEASRQVYKTLLTRYQDLQSRLVSSLDH